MSGSKQLVKTNWVPRALIFAAIGIGIGFGTCFIGFQQKHPNSEFGGDNPVAKVGAALFFISLLAFILILVTAAIMQIVNIFRR